MLPVLGGLALLILRPLPSAAVVEVFDRGPALIAGRYRMRMSNAGIMGNPYPTLSADPSFEYPQGSGEELMNFAALWVGALDGQGIPRVSGAPLLEFRATSSPSDTVREAWHGRFGSQRSIDDDGDGRVDEERLNDRDDDGDGEVDEDLGLNGQQMLTAEYTDDQPEAVHVYIGEELHRPLGLSVYQETYAYAYPGFDGIAGLQYTITNHSNATLHEVYVGLYVDLDLRTENDPLTYSDDTIGRGSFSRTFSKGSTSVFVDGVGTLSFNCSNRMSGTVPYIKAPPGQERQLAVGAVMGLEHTVDPLSSFFPALGRAPASSAFRYSIFAADLGGAQGGLPLQDSDRYLALKGEWPQSADDHVGDQIVLLSCGPFHTLGPGQSISFAAALVASTGPESLQVALGNAAFAYNGTELNLQPDNQGPARTWWIVGDTGINGHEACMEAPPGFTFEVDPHCSAKFGSALSDPPRQVPHIFRPGEPCFWTDADCNICTGMNGRETVLRWLNPNDMPPSPNVRALAGDRQVRIQWDNLSEVLIAAGKAGPRGGKFVGYRVHRLADWRRATLMPGRDNWAALATAGYDESNSKILLSSLTDSTLDYERIWFEQKLYPVGRYEYVDREAKNGFDYIYIVTALVEVQTVLGGRPRIERYEGPVVAEFGQRVVPSAAAQEDAKGVWVVPNPFRANADWDRTPVFGDRLTRHLDFMGLPRARSTIRIWTVAGDHVATIEHDGTQGDGQASWDLISRNGQDVSSGVYIFTVDSSLGSSRGRFVVIR